MNEKKRLDIRWTLDASGDLENALDHLRKESPVAADGLSKALEGSLEQLRDFPNLGRQGRLQGTRELVMTVWPYVIPYRVRDGVLEIVRVFHGSRAWPPEHREKR